MDATKLCQEPILPNRESFLRKQLKRKVKVPYKRYTDTIYPELTVFQSQMPHCILVKRPNSTQTENYLVNFSTDAGGSKSTDPSHKTTQENAAFQNQNLSSNSMPPKKKRQTK